MAHEPDAQRETPIRDAAVGSAALRQTAERLEGAPRGRVALGHVWGAAVPLTAGALAELTGRTVLLVTGHVEAADDAADDAEVLCGARPPVLPAWTHGPSVAATASATESAPDAWHVNDEIAGERLAVCDALASPGAAQTPDVPGMVVTSLLALLQSVPRLEELSRGRRGLCRDAELSPEDLAAWLVDGGFEPVEQVDQPGQFARRGGIVDIFAPGTVDPVRVEFFGDRIDSLRLFNLDTQRSTTTLDACDIRAVATGRQTAPDRTTSFLDYLPDDAIVCLPDPDGLRTQAAEIHHRLTQQDERAGLLDAGDLLTGLERFAHAEMHAFAAPRRADAIDLNVRSVQRFSYNTAEALDELGCLGEGVDLWVFCENEAERKRFSELLAAQAPQLGERLRMAIGHISAGFAWDAEGLVVIAHHEIFHRYARRRRVRRVAGARAGRPIEALTDLRPGDYVVHVAHGIAKFEGLRTLERDGRTQECLSLRFAGGALLHVPAGRIDLVQKYVAPRRARPTLSTLGGSAWSHRRQRVSEAAEDVAAEMLRIQAMRRASPGVRYPRTSSWQAQFAAEFLYTETADQLAAMEAIDADMAAGRPTDRLLCGDVGYGKTELAMRAAFKAVEAGRQVAVLVPTTVLAAQHARTFAERFADYPVAIDVLSRFRTGAEQRDVLERLAGGTLDVLIGTHRLLSDDVRFAELGLVVIDEEQRFGVEHKEKLKAMRASVEVLTLTATPIPRTLHMALLGLRDISSLATPPLDRRAIHTEVVHYDEGLIRTAVLREMSRDGQVFFVHNRVFDIQSFADRVRRTVPEARIGIAHGQMPGGALERTMVRFVRGELDVLVCTTIIESGLDIPAANTMIIHDADRYGLAELHQLRGRVGRYKHLAYCYLLLPERRPVRPVAAKRLKAIEEFADLGAGFHIAMRDLEIRGAGNLLGKAQSGHIAAVGYEMYCRLLGRAVRRLKGEPEPPQRVCHVDLGIDAYIPRAYVSADAQRMEIYRRLARCEDAAALEQLRADLRDAYGPPPDEFETLLDVGEVRLRASAAGIESIVLHGRDVIFTVGDFDRARAVFDGAAGSVRLPDARTVHWRPPPRYLEMPTLVTMLLRQVRRADESA
ncbi:MAG: transcription-repair coupling factor [Phycisphaerae bacterium]|nr:transcription-repair coupling factor [Phycisphaerae bacterium]